MRRDRTKHRELRPQKLELKKETLRQLQPEDLEQVHGGGKWGLKISRYCAL